MPNAGYKSVTLGEETVAMLETLRARYGLRSIPETVIKLADKGLAEAEGKPMKVWVYGYTTDSNGPDEDVILGVSKTEKTTDMKAKDGDRIDWVTDWHLEE